MTKTATEAITKADAILSLKPLAKWSMSGDVVTWLDSSYTEPTTSEIDTELTRLRTEYTNKEYQRKRRIAYPNIGDQLDDLYKKGAFSDDMAAKLKKVKDDNPKP